MGRALRLLGDASARCWSYTRVSIHAAISRTPYHASERSYNWTAISETPAGVIVQTQKTADRSP